MKSKRAAAGVTQFEHEFVQLSLVSELRRAFSVTLYTPIINLKKSRLCFDNFLK